jgi:hypothetical protein
VRIKNVYKLDVEKLKKNRSKEETADMRAALKWILVPQDVKLWTGLKVPQYKMQLRTVTKFLKKHTS